MDNKKTAIVSGASGLVGEQLLSKLLNDPFYGKVIAVGRKPLIINHPRLEQRIIDFELLPGVLSGMKADHGFCCLGTTIREAGSKERQYRIDHDYVVEFGRACYDGGVAAFAVVSSIGANKSSSNFYLRTKGEMEADLQKIPFQRLFILQPSMLLGNRKVFRLGERIGIAAMKLFNPMLIGGMRKYRGVQAEAVAGCMISLVKSEKSGITIIPSDKI